MSTPKSVTIPGGEIVTMGPIMTGIAKRVQDLREGLDLSQSELARRCGEKPQTLQKLEAGIVQRPRYILDLARVLRTTTDWLLLGTGEITLKNTDNLPQNNRFDSKQASAIESPQLPVKLPPLEEMPHDLPLLGSARGGKEGAFELNDGHPIAYLKRRPGVAGSPKAYALYVEGDSMEPRYFPGELIHIDPSRKIRPGDFVLIEQVLDEYDVPQAFIKRLVRRTAKKIIVEQYNPPKTIDMPENSIKTMHRVLLSNEVDGV